MKFLVPESAPKYKRKWGRVCESHLEALDSGERNRFSPSAPAGLPKIALPASASAPCTSNSFLGPQALHQGWPTQYHLHRSFFSDFLYPTWVPPPDLWTVCLVHVFGFRLSERPSEARDSFLPLHAMGMPQHLLNFLTHVVCSWFIPNVSVELTSPLTTALVCRLSCPSSPAVYT